VPSPSAHVCQHRSGRNFALRPPSGRPAGLTLAEFPAESFLRRRPLAECVAFLAGVSVSRLPSAPPARSRLRARSASNWLNAGGGSTPARRRHYLDSSCEGPKSALDKTGRPCSFSLRRVQARTCVRSSGERGLQDNAVMGGSLSRVVDLSRGRVGYRMGNTSIRLAETPCLRASQT